MSIGKILTFVSGAEPDHATLATAFAAARPFNAHVRVLFVEANLRDAIPAAPEAFAPEAIQKLLQSAKNAAVAASRMARGALATEAEKAKVRILAIQQRDGVTASYLRRTGALVDCLMDESRLCDLIVFPPIAKNAKPDLHDALVQLLNKCGHPVLLSPLQPPPHVGQIIDVSWDTRLTSAYALSAAMPFLQRAKTIQLLAVGYPSANIPSFDDVTVYLALNGVSCSGRFIPQNSHGVAELLLDRAAQDQCDLLVIGGYGHSRTREALFGGPTEYLASHTTVPLLLMH